MNYLGRFAYTLVFLIIGEFASSPEVPTVNAPKELGFPVVSSLQIDTTIISECGLNFRIFDFSCTASNNYTITVNTVPGTQLGQDIVLEEVRIIVDHDWNADLDISLRSPNGTWVEISSDNGGASNDYGDPTDLSCNRYARFSMSACQSITVGEGPFLDHFLPEGNFNDYNDGSNPNGDWVLQLCDDALGDIGTLKSIQLVFTNQTFRQITSIDADTFASNYARLNWVSNNPTCTNTLIEYGPPGFIPGTGNQAGEGTLVSLSCPVSQPYQLNGLSEFTDYEVYLREFDGNVTYSLNSCPFAFTTECNTAPLTLRETFDSQTDCGQDCGTSCDLTGVWKNAAADDFDWLINSGPTSTADTGPSDDITGGGQYLYVETSRRNCRNGALAILESNCLQINAASGQCHLSFYYHMFGVEVNSLQVDISTNNGETWTTLWSVLGEQGDRWIKNYVDLSAYNGQIARIRLLGLGGSGRRGDLAIDDIRFYGTTDLGDSPFVFYQDSDGDGFGDPNSPVPSCIDVIPDGAVQDFSDCDDTNPSIFPNAPEVLCNGIDENCNGPSDDGILPFPQVADQIVCQGAPLTINLPSSVGDYYWFAGLTDSEPLFVGNDFLLPNTDTSSTYFVIDSISATCSSERIAFNILVNPVPELFVNSIDPICEGNIVDLSTLAIADAKQLDGQITFHSGSPATVGNELNSSIVQPIVNTTYYIKKTTNEGCSAEIPIDIGVFPAPNAIISPAEDIPLCTGETVLVSVTPASGVSTPATFRWSNGTRGEQVELSAGIAGQVDPYYVTITDARGCTQVDSVLIRTANSVSSVRIDAINDVTSCGGSDGAITLSPLDGTGPFNYLWSGPVNGSISGVNGTYQIQNLPQGTYRVTIVDQEPPACSFVLPIIVVNGPAVVVDPNILIEQESCFGANDGFINLTVFANNPIFEWSNGDTTEDLTGVGAGLYSVTITDSNCSVILEDLRIESPPELIVDVFNINLASCPGNADGGIDISVRGGNSPYTFIWSNGSSNEDLTNIPAGLYSVTVTDANACDMSIDNTRVGHRPALTVLPLESRSPLCAGDETGLIRVEGREGTPPYKYEWSNGVRSPILAGIPAGVYTLTLTDAAGCTDIYTYLLEDALPIELTFVNLQAPSCNGVFDGIISIEAIGGTAPYTYLWSDGVNGPIRNQLGEGMYSCEITDANGCSFESGAISLVAPVSLIIDDLFAGDASCLGINDGFIDLTITGGTPPYTYDWSHGASVEDPTGLSSGFYTVTVTDQNGCFITSSEIEIVLLEPLAVNIELIVNPLCGNSSDGLIELRTEALARPVTYQWNTGQTTEDLRNLPVGDYACTITDANGCLSFIDTITLTAPPPIEIEIIDREFPSCFGLPQGVVSVEVIGGVPPYTYQWSNGDTSRNLSGVEAGSYYLFVQDSIGCAKSSEEVIIEEPEELNVEILDVVPAGCLNVFGSIEVRPLGGTSPYNIIWTTGDTTFSIHNLDPGDYGLTLTDSEGCLRLQSSIEVFITPEEFEIAVLEKTDVSCAGEADGNIVPSPQGGQGPYQFNWSNGQIDSINTNLPPGSYSLTMTDRNGCTGSISGIEVSTEPPIQYQVTEIQDALCYGEASGLIRLSVQGGSPPYEVNWSNNDTGLVVDELLSGRYEFTITDARGCQTESAGFWEVGQPEVELTIGQLLLQSATCSDAQDGAAQLMITGGTEPYQFYWSTGDTTNYVEGLIADSTYACTVIDANGCELPIQSIEVSSPDSLIVAYEKMPARFGQADGSLAAIPSGGTPPYQYRWDLGSGFSSDSLVTDLPAGTYAFTLTDANFCTIEDSVVLEQGLSSAINNLAAQVKIALLPNPVRQGSPFAMLFDARISGKVELSIISVNGRLVHQQIETVSAGDKLYVDHNMPVGLYFVKIDFKEYGTAIRKLVIME